MQKARALKLGPLSEETAASNANSNSLPPTPLPSFYIIDQIERNNRTAVAFC